MIRTYSVFLFMLLFVKSVAFADEGVRIYKSTVNSTVTIETNSGKLGSGFFVGPYTIVTNYHVIEGATGAVCYLNNSKVKYEIEGYFAVDKGVDLAILKVKNLSRAKIPFSRVQVTPGQKIYVIGSPKGLPATISDGIVSGLRDFNGHKKVQITAPISSGSSGGPVLNSKGELIGVSVSSVKGGQNLNFAIPRSNVELLLSFKRKVRPLSNLVYRMPASRGRQGSIYGKDRLSGVYKINRRKSTFSGLTLDYMSRYGGNTIFFFTYKPMNASMKFETIWMEDYRLVDKVSGKVYYASKTNLPSASNPRIIYKGTFTRFSVVFEDVPSELKHFSLREGKCESNNFCFENLYTKYFTRAVDFKMHRYTNTNKEGTITFYKNQASIGEIKVYVEGVYVGKLTEYFKNASYKPSCGDVTKANITLRLPVGTYHYKATSRDLHWKGKFTISKNGCMPFRLYRN